MTNKCKLALHLPAAIAVAASVAVGMAAQGQQPGKFRSPPAGTGVARNWAHFLGPNYNGVPSVTGRFDPKGIQRIWSHELGPGCASVTIVDGKLYTMGNRKDQDVIYCIDPRTGEENWRVAYDCGLMAQNYEGGPSSTPTVANGCLYAFSRKGQVHCVDARNGKYIWATSVEKWSPKGAWWGFADLPIVWEDRVFLNVTKKGLAMNRETGEILWSGRECCSVLCHDPASSLGQSRARPSCLVVQTCQNVDIVDPDTGASYLGEVPDWAKRRSNNNAVTPTVFQNSLILMHGQHGLGKVSRKGGHWVEDWLCKDLIYNQWDWFTFNQQVIHNGHLIALAGRGTKASDRMMCVEPRDRASDVADAGTFRQPNPGRRQAHHRHAVRRDFLGCAGRHSVQGDVSQETAQRTILVASGPARRVSVRAYERWHADMPAI